MRKVDRRWTTVISILKWFVFWVKSMVGEHLGIGARPPSTKEVGNTPQDPRTSTRSAHVKIDLAVEIQYPCLFRRADLSPVMRSAIVWN